MTEKYYCPKSCELQGEKCSWETKPELSSQPEDANHLNYCPFFLMTEQEKCPEPNCVDGQIPIPEGQSTGQYRPCPTCQGTGEKPVNSSLNGELRGISYEEVVAWALNNGYSEKDLNPPGLWSGGINRSAQLDADKKAVALFPDVDQIKQAKDDERENSIKALEAYSEKNPDETLATAIAWLKFRQETASAHRQSLKDS